MKTRKMPNYEQGRIAVDPVIFTIKNQKLWVYLDTRKENPYKNSGELPGGLLLQKETAEETLARKLKNVVGTENIFFQQFYTFTYPKRDPRVRTVSIGFIALIPQEKVLNVRNFYRLDNLPKLAFDHRQIINKAFEYIQQNLNHKLVNQFMPVSFPLNDLQTVYEIINQRKLDNRNFRKKVLGSGIVKKIKKIQKNVAHRPAELYKFA